MGGISRVHFSRYKSLLRLSDEAWELADKHNLEEWKLRYVLNLPTDAHAEMVKHIIEFNLTGRQIRELCAEGLDKDEESKNIPPVDKQLTKFAATMRKINNYDLIQMADVLLEQEEDVHMASARIDGMIGL